MVAFIVAMIDNAPSWMMTSVEGIPGIRVCQFESEGKKHFDLKLASIQLVQYCIL